jgi:hypothetical protein
METLNDAKQKELVKLIKSVDSKESSAVNAADKVADFLITEVYDATRPAVKEADFIMSFAKSLSDDNKIVLKYSKNVWSKIKHQVSIAVLIQAKPNAVVDFTINERGKSKTFTMTPEELKTAGVKQKAAAAAQIRKELGTSDGRAGNKRAPQTPAAPVTPDTIKTPAATETTKKTTGRRQPKNYEMQVKDALLLVGDADEFIDALVVYRDKIKSAANRRGYIITIAEKSAVVKAQKKAPAKKTTTRRAPRKPVAPAPSASA